MKKFLISILSCFLIITLCACENNNKDDVEDTTDDSIVDSEPDNGGDDEEANEEITVALNASTKNVRFLGERENRDSGYVSCNYPGSGFESKFNCAGGTVSVRVMADGECTFLVYLDGTLQKSATVLGNRLISLDDVSEGEHVLRFIRATDFGTDVKLYAIVLTGEVLEADGASQERLFVEFIGDAAELSDDITKTYPYLIASQMNVDYSVTAYSGSSLCTDKDKKIIDLYGVEKNGNFKRNADIAVVNIGALDAVTADSESADEIKSAYKSFVKKIRIVNGGNCRIVFVCNSANSEFQSIVSDIYDTMGGEGIGCYLVMLNASAAIMPTEAEHAAYASALMDAMNKAKDYRAPVISNEESGTGDSFGFTSDKWEEL